MSTTLHRIAAAPARPERTPRRSGRRRLPPVPVLIALALTAGIVLIACLPGRPDDGARVLATRSLRAVTAADESVTLLDAVSGAPLQRLPGNQDSFARGVFHGTDIRRRRYGISLQAPYALTALSDGRLVLDDPGTHTAIELEAFGTTNETSFRQLLQAPAPEPRS